MPNNPPGWFPDPYGRAQVRWWSGSGWTDHVATNGQEFLDPPGAGPLAGAPTGPAPGTATGAATIGPAAATAAPATRWTPATKRTAIVGVVALLVGVLGGWLLRGDGSGGSGSGGGGAADGTLTAPVLSGLASLNSYEWVISAVTVGPTDADRSEVVGNGASDSAAELRYQKMVNTDTTADDPEPSTSTTETWRTADSTCEYDGEDYYVDPANPFEADLGSVLAGVFDIVVPAGNATLVGTEQVAGVDTEHHRFTIEGLGAGTGTQVDQNQGDLWVAVDGDYLVRYQVTAAMRSTAADGTVEVYSITVNLELTSVNQPVTITVPSGCAATPDTTTG